MNSSLFITLLACSITSALCTNAKWNCSQSEAIKSFKTKTLINQYQSFTNDPYKNQTAESMNQINKVLLDREMVCAIKYQDESRTTYSIQTFASAMLAIEAGHIITHQGPCGACSNTNDLAVYLSTDLTSPARRSVIFNP